MNFRMIALSFYNLILAVGAIWTGIQMIHSSNGIFREYPHEWIGKLPFHNWVLPGVLAIAVFGVGNLIAAIFTWQKKKKISWAASAIMGGIFFISLIFQVLLLGKTYLATIEFFLLSLIQLGLSGLVFSGYRKTRTFQ